MVRNKFVVLNFSEISWDVFVRIAFNDLFCLSCHIYDLHKQDCTKKMQINLIINTQ